MPIIAHTDGWILQTQTTAYALGFDSDGRLVNRWWGVRLPYPEDYPAPPDSDGYASFNGPAHLLPEEYPAYADGLNYTEPCLKLTYPDEVRAVILKLEDSTHSDDTLILTLTDPAYPALHVMLYYTLHAQTDIIARRAVITNTGNVPITLERVWSALWYIPQDGLNFRHFTGRWNDEFILREETLTHGVKTIESRRLTTSHHHNPYFALHRDATEDSGDVWFGLLAWSGNWSIRAEVTDFGGVRLGVGVNDWDFAYQLNAGESFRTPTAYAGYTQGGFSAASRNLHACLRGTLPHAGQPRKVLFNSWEVSEFDVNEASQKGFAQAAAAIGCELFVMDDGWFNGRDSDSAGLGDWWPDARKFPDGLTPLVTHVNALGMDFGLWIEPEMVNPASDLYRKHPDWVIHHPNRPRTQARNQLILNLARTDVQEYLITALDKLLTQHNIAFIKWDMNRNVSEAGWPDAPGHPRELWVRYVDGLYHVWGTLRQRHPGVLWQSCSGGGGRADWGILRYADQIWLSDNTDPTRRLPMQANFSHVFPPETLESWVTDMGADYLPLAFRYHVSMCGVLGVGADITRWSDKQRDQARQLTEAYKAVRDVIQFGDVFRLVQTDPYYAMQYLDATAENGVLFVFRTYAPEPTAPMRVRLRGLQPDRLYRVEDHAVVRSGAAWMADGLTVVLGNFESRLLKLTAT